MVGQPWLCNEYFKHNYLRTIRRGIAKLNNNIFFQSNISQDIALLTTYVHLCQITCTLPI